MAALDREQIKRILRPTSLPRARKRTLRQSSLARHWARDWLALALTQVHGKELYDRAPSHDTGHGTGAHWHKTLLSQQTGSTQVRTGASPAVASVGRDGKCGNRWPHEAKLLLGFPSAYTALPLCVRVLALDGLDRPGPRPRVPPPHPLAPVPALHAQNRLAGAWQRVAASDERPHAPHPRGVRRHTGKDLRVANEEVTYVVPSRCLVACALGNSTATDARRCPSRCAGAGSPCTRRRWRSWRRRRRA